MENRKNKREWWDNLSERWKEIFYANLGNKIIEDFDLEHLEIKDDELDKVLNIEELRCHYKIYQRFTNNELIGVNRVKIKSLEPIKHLLNLKFLDFSNNQIEDLSPIKNLNKLEFINIYNNPIVDAEIDNFRLSNSNCAIFPIDSL